MKFFIAFMLLFLVNCLESSAISATINSKNGVSNSTVNLDKKLTFKESLIFKLSKNKLDNTTKKANNWLLPILLIIAGIILMLVSNYQQASAPPPPNGAIYANLTVGWGTAFFAILSFGIGWCMILTRLFKRLKINNPN